MHTCTLAPLPRLPFFNLLPFHTHSNTHTQCFVLSHLSNTADLFQHDSDFSLPFILLHCFCYWVAVGEGRSYECQRVCLGDISHCLLFRIKRELGEWSNTFLSWERQSVFRTPTEADKKKEKEMRREIGNEQRRNGGRKRRRASGRETKSGVWWEKGNRDGERRESLRSGEKFVKDG